MASVKIELLFSDDMIGCSEFGFIKREGFEEDEDYAYERHVRRIYRGKNINCSVHVCDGVLIVESL